MLTVSFSSTIEIGESQPYPNDCWCWEVPAGGLHDHQGSLEALARRELAQEIGATCDELVYVNWFYGANSVLNEVCHVLLAPGRGWTASQSVR